MALSTLRTKIRTNPVPIALLIGLAALCIYLRTLATTVVFNDGGEQATAAYLGGVAHPSGYPLYMMVGYLVTHFLPIGSIIYRMNLISAVAGAGAVAVFYLLALRIVRSRLASLVAALLLAFSLTFWSQAVVADEYTLHLLFVVATLLCVVAWDAKGERRWLLAGALIWGLSFAHHLTTMLLAPALLYFVLTSRHRGQCIRELRWTVPLFLMPLLLYLYLPLASLHDPAWTFADIRSWNGFIHHVIGQQYHNKVGITSREMLQQRLMEYAGPVIDDDRPGHHDNPGYLLSQFSLSLLWLAPWGAYGLLRRRRRLFGLTLLVYLAVMVWALSYNIENIEVYYIPAHMIVALWIGCGLRQLSVLLARLWRKIVVPRKSRRRLITAFGMALLGLPVMLLTLNWHIDDARQNHSSEWLGHAILDSVKPHAILLCDGDRWAIPELYPHYVENRRPDVTIIPVLFFLEPTDIHLITRLSAQGLNVRVPKGYLQHPAETDTRLLTRFITDNLSARPIYMAGPKMWALAQMPQLRAAIPALIPVAAAEPFFEIQVRRHTTSAKLGNRLAGVRLPLQAASRVAKRDPND